MTSETYRVEVGELGLLGAAAHLSIRFTESDGTPLFEINGLATDKQGSKMPIGVAVLGHTLQAYDDVTYSGKSNFRSVDTLGTRPRSEWESDLKNTPSRYCKDK